MPKKGDKSTYIQKNLKSSEIVKFFYLHYVAHEITIWFWKNSHFENMTAGFWGIKIQSGKQWFLNIDSSIVIALQTGLKEMIKQSFLRKAKNRNKCKVISLFAELLFSIFSYLTCFETTCL